MEPMKPMTRTAEELKHAMYHELNQITGEARFDPFQSALEEYLEALRKEAAGHARHLALTVENCDILRDAYSHQQGLTHSACVEAREALTETYELKNRVRELQEFNDCGHSASLQDKATIQCLREELDQTRSKLQAFEFANKSAGELLIDSRAKVKAQRQSIGKLKNERDNALHTVKVRTSQRDGLEARLASVRTELSEARKSLGSTSAQNNGEILPKANSDDFAGVIDANYLDKTLGEFVYAWKKHLDVIDAETK